MKIKLLVASVALATSQFAAAEVVIGHGGESTQEVLGLAGALIVNEAEGTGLKATQNLSSNAGDVRIDGKSDQFTGVGAVGIMINAAIGGNATQNASSNADRVMISSGAESTQTTAVAGFAAAANLAVGPLSYANQNMSSNFGHVMVSGESTQTTILAPLALAVNVSEGLLSYAAQNMSSNFGHVRVEGKSEQSTWVGGGIVANLATGAGTEARQNLASNTSCDIDQKCELFSWKPKW